MLSPVTGRFGGKIKSTVVKVMYDSAIMSAVQPNHVGSVQ